MKGELSDPGSGKPQDATDEELARTVSENPEVFGILMQRYEKKLMTYILRKSNVTREVAEDLLQESFLKAYQNINNFDTRLSFSSWIYRIVHNQTISGWRKAKVRPEGNAIEVDTDFLGRIASDEDLARIVNQQYLIKNITTIFAEMDEKYRNVLVLRFMEEKSYEEIADIIKKPMGTVATYLSRAKKQFIKMSDKRNNDLFPDEKA